MAMAAWLAASCNQQRLMLHRAAVRGASSDAYQKTLCLPKTAFPMRAQGAVREPLIQKNCFAGLYEWQKSRPGDGRAPFILHDGPPFANGPPHMGHALNKILKDIICRYHMMSGAPVSHVPGWDCHGLPIELKAIEAYAKSSKKSLSSAPATELRQYAKKFALEAIDVQRTAFKRWGVLADWEHPYLTMDPLYEVEQLKVFKAMFDKGYIYRGRKPVYWSPSSGTALAEAELEYQDLPSHSAYISFSLAPGPALRAAVAGTEPVALIIWTTTPWTIPANHAVSVNADISYAVVRARPRDAPSSSLFVVAHSLLATVADMLFAGPHEVVATVPGKALSDSTYSHPLRDASERHPVITAEFVTDSAGTGLVHTAPAHGTDDHLACVRRNIASRYHLVDDKGRFNSEAHPRLRGKPVLAQGSEEVLHMLREAGALLASAMITHRYPIDWRTKKPVLVRETMQWFADLSTLRQSAAAALQGVQMVPEQARKRMEAMLATRTEWCISRQRTWGVPIPVFYNESGEPLLTDASFAHTLKCVQQHGADCWWKLSAEELLAPEYHNDGHTYTRGSDTMDVWFDSGSSWRAAVQRREGDGKVSDVVLEGSDQHRGWFQSSLLTAVATGMLPGAPYKAVITHGFVLDEQGRKMSKSLGNGVDPTVVVMGGPDAKAQPAYGADVLRVWVAGNNYTGDVHIGSSSLKIASETLRKLRNTARFMVGNLHDFDTTTDLVPADQLRPVDRYMLHLLGGFAGYEQSAFYNVLRSLLSFANNDLSAFYFEVSKDRLYAAKPHSLERRSAQTTLHHLEEVFSRCLAPIACHLAEEIHSFRHGKDPAQSACDSILKAGFASSLPPALGVRAVSDYGSLIEQQAELERWSVLREVRRVVYKVIHEARMAGVVLDAGDSDVVVVAGDAERQLLHGLGLECLKDVLLCANVQVVGADAAEDAQRPVTKGTHEIVTAHGGSSLAVSVRKTQLRKCLRCWQFSVAGSADVCGRCEAVLESSAQ